MWIDEEVVPGSVRLGSTRFPGPLSVRPSYGLLLLTLIAPVSFLQDLMSMPVQLKRQPSEEKPENGVGHMEHSDIPRGPDSPVKQLKGTRFPSNKGAMVSDHLGRGCRCISLSKSNAPES